MSTSPVDSAHRLTPRPAPPDQGDTREPFRRWLEDSSLPTLLAATAFGGSYFHLVTLAHRSGVHGPEGYVTAACIDAIVAMAARERQRDKRIRRETTGRPSYPFLIMVGGTLLSLAAQLAVAQHTAWGYVSAAIPLVAFLAALGIIERRSAESHRRAREYAEQLAAWEHAESERLALIERQRQEAAEDLERQRLEAETAERNRLAREADRQRRLLEAQQRHPLTVTQTQETVTSGPSPRAIEAVPVITDVPAPADRTTATDVMRAHWEAEIAHGRLPSGADLLRAAGLPSSSSFGRQMRAKWITEVPAELISNGAA